MPQEVPDFGRPYMGVVGTGVQSRSRSSDQRSEVTVSAQRITSGKHCHRVPRRIGFGCLQEQAGNALDPRFRGGHLNPHRQVDNVAGRVNPNHEAGRFPFLGSRLYFVQACCGQIYGGCFQKPIEVANILEVLDCHVATPLPRILGILGREPRRDMNQ